MYSKKTTNCDYDDDVYNDYYGNRSFDNVGWVELARRRNLAVAESDGAALVQ